MSITRMSRARRIGRQVEQGRLWLGVFDLDQCSSGLNLISYVQ
jgi:hypothetical protein